jgi:P27 family predicted phage terminase small subunit
MSLPPFRGRGLPASAVHIPCASIPAPKKEITVRGRKPRPVELRVIEGNPGKRRLTKPLRVDRGLPEPPEHLDAIALAEWARMSTELRANGLLTRSDRAALAAYCMAYSRWVQAEAEIARRGMLYQRPNGAWQQSPFVVIAHRAMMIMAAFLSEFGMTPVSRTRLSVAEGGADADNHYAGL